VQVGTLDGWPPGTAWTTVSARRAERMKEKECIFAREVGNEGNEQKVGPQVGVLVTFLYLLLRGVYTRRVVVG